MSKGALTPRTYPSDRITVRCDRCNRLGHYWRQTIIARFGPDQAMPDLLARITACERNHTLSTDRCRAHFAELRERRQPTA